MQALAEYDTGICDCGFHQSITDNPANLLKIEERVCNVCVAAARYSRLQDYADEQASKQMGEVPPGAPAPGDGRKTYVVRDIAGEMARASRPRAH